MPTARDLVTAALTELGVLSAGEAPSAHDGAWGLQKLNKLLSLWNTRTLNVYAELAVGPFTLTAGDSSYTIGSGADFNVSRPNRIKRANLIQANTNPAVRFPLHVLTTQEWSELSIQTLSGTLPVAIYNDEAAPTATIRVYPAPDAAHQIELYVEQKWTSFTDLDTPVVTFSDGWEEAIVLSLARALAPGFGVQVSSELVTNWKTAMDAVQTLRARAPLIGTGDGITSSSPQENWGAILTGRVW